MCLILGDNFGRLGELFIKIFGLMALAYTKLVLEHFHHPRNVGEVKNPDAEATVGSPACGDMLHMSMRLGGRIIKEIRFRSYGCASSIATGSMVTELIKGMSVDEAEQISWREVVERLGGLPPVKIHCSILAIDTLREAIKRWKVKQGELEPEELVLSAKNIRTVVADVVYGASGATLFELGIVVRVRVEKEEKNLELTLALASDDEFWYNITQEMEEHLRAEWGDLAAVNFLANISK